MFLSFVVVFLEVEVALGLLLDHRHRARRCGIECAVNPLGAARKACDGAPTRRQKPKTFLAAVI